MNNAFLIPSLRGEIWSKKRSGPKTENGILKLTGLTLDCTKISDLFSVESTPPNGTLNFLVNAVSFVGINAKIRICPLKVLCLHLFSSHAYS